jgi:hypothetical protein
MEKEKSLKTVPTKQADRKGNFTFMKKVSSSNKDNKE